MMSARQRLTIGAIVISALFLAFGGGAVVFQKQVDRRVERERLPSPKPVPCWEAPR